MMTHRKELKHIRVPVLMVKTVYCNTVHVGIFWHLLLCLSVQTVDSFSKLHMSVQYKIFF